MSTAWTDEMALIRMSLQWLAITLDKGIDTDGHYKLYMLIFVCLGYKVNVAYCTVKMIRTAFQSLLNFMKQQIEFGRKLTTTRAREWLSQR